jgi:hypothetical protein
MTKDLQEYKEKASAGAKIIDWLQKQLYARADRNC